MSADLLSKNNHYETDNLLDGLNNESINDNNKNGKKLKKKIIVEENKK